MNNETNIASINIDLNVVENSTLIIKKLIHTVRGKQVMLDCDVAKLYHYQTKRINETVKRNKKRFPENFCFQLTEIEMENLKLKNAISDIKKENNWSQDATGSENRRKKYLPYVFTEQGIAMLAGLLRNEIAIQVSINIMNAFVEMRKFLYTNGQVFERLINIENKLIEHNNKINQIFSERKEPNNIELSQKIFYKGQIWDSYELIIDIIKKAQNKIVIIDNYIDDSILKMLKKKNKNVKVTIMTSHFCNISNLDVNKFNKQYPMLKIIRTNKFHDRFIILDGKEMYHCGASFKDLGTKCFGINKMEENHFIEDVERVYNISLEF